MGVDPLSLAIGAGTVAAGGLAAFGTLDAGKAASAQTVYQAEVARMNANIAEGNARRVLEASQVQALENDTQTGQVIGSQIAGQGASNLDVGSKSFQDVRESTQQVGRQGTLNIIQAGEVEAFNARVDAANFRSDAASLEADAVNIKRASKIDATGQILSSLVGGATAVRRPQRFANPAPRDVPEAKILS